MAKFLLDKFRDRSQGKIMSKPSARRNLFVELRGGKRCAHAIDRIVNNCDSVSGIISRGKKSIEV